MKLERTQGCVRLESSDSFCVKRARWQDRAREKEDSREMWSVKTQGYKWCERSDRSRTSVSAEGGRWGKSHDYWYFPSGESLQGVGEDRDRETEGPVGWTRGGTAPDVDRGVSLPLPTPFTLSRVDYSSGGQNPTLTLDSVGWRLVCLPISKVLYEIILIQTEEMKLGGWGCGTREKDYFLSVSGQKTPVKRVLKDCKFSLEYLSHVMWLLTKKITLQFIFYKALSVSCLG